MSHHGSQSPSIRAAGSSDTAENSAPRATDDAQTPPPLGISELQSPLITKCSELVRKFKSGLIKKSKVGFKIYSILTTLGEKAEVIKSAVESYLDILDQYETNQVSALKRGRIESD